MTGDEETKAQGTCSGTIKLHKKFPCPIPELCEKKDPLDYEQWGAHECSIKEYGEYGEDLATITWATSYNISYSIDKRLVFPEFLDVEKKPKFPISDYVIENFQVSYQREMAREKPEEKKDKDTSNLESRLEFWKFISWKYHHAEIIPEDNNRIRQKWKNFRLQVDFEDSWTGNGKQKEFKIRGGLLPIDEEPRPKIFVAGKLMEEEVDYEINPSEGKVIFNTPPADMVAIEIIYYWSNKAKEDSKAGASLYYIKELGKIETFNSNGENRIFPLAGIGIRKNSVEVKVDGNLKLRGQDYFLMPTYKKRKRAYILEFAEPPPDEKKIEVSYQDEKFQGESDIEVEPEAFFSSKRRALEVLDMFSRILRNSNPDWFKKGGKDKQLQDVRENIEKWDMPFPSRLLTDEEKKLLNDLVPYTGECLKCGHIPVIEKDGQKDPITFKIKYNGEIKSKCEEIKEDGNKCGGTIKIGNFKEIHDFTSTDLAWFTDKMISGKIRTEIDKSCKTEPIAVFFQKDKPIPGETRAEIESDLLNTKLMKDKKDPNITLDLTRIAEILAKQILKFKNERIIPVIYYRGYADQSAPKTNRCDYNEKLSLRRADWVQWKIEHILKKEFNIEPSVLSNKIYGCGEGYNDRKPKDDQNKHRVVIIELDYARPVEEFKIT